MSDKNIFGEQKIPGILEPETSSKSNYGEEMSLENFLKNEIAANEGKGHGIDILDQKDKLPGLFDPGNLAQGAAKPEEVGKVIAQHEETEKIVEVKPEGKHVDNIPDVLIDLSEPIEIPKFEPEEKKPLNGHPEKFMARKIENLIDMAKDSELENKPLIIPTIETVHVDDIAAENAEKQAFGAKQEVEPIVAPGSALSEGLKDAEPEGHVPVPFFDREKEMSGKREDIGNEKETAKPEERKPVVPDVKKHVLEEPRVEDEPGKDENREVGAKPFLGRTLDTWFNKERLNPTVESLIYWRDVKLSGLVFGSVLIVLLSLAYFSLISVVANLGLCVLSLTIGFRVYKDILQAIQKTPQVHPLQEYLSMEISLSQEKVQHLVDCSLVHFNACIVELRRLFLVENLIDSLKFAIVLWVFTYVGAWFNGLTLVIIGFIALFTVPKIYESNKAQVDQNVKIVQQKFEEISKKIAESLPAPLKRRLPEKKD